MIQVVNRALDIIEFIASSGKKDVLLKDIADGLDLNHGTCANIIKTLLTRDYLERAPEGKGYRLGPMFYFIAGDYSYSVDLINAAKESMHNLTELINESCMLGILRNDTRVSLYEVHAMQELQVVNKKEKPAYQTASGRLLLAYLSPEKRTAFINKYGLPPAEVWEDVQEEEDLIFELDKIVRKGIAIQIASSKILGVAVPLWQEDQVIASLGVFLPEFRFEGVVKTKIIEEMQKTASIISNNINQSLTVQKLKI